MTPEDEMEYYDSLMSELWSIENEKQIKSNTTRERETKQAKDANIRQARRW